TMGTMGRRRPEILRDGFMHSLAFLSGARHLYGRNNPWKDTRIRKNNAIEECTHPRILASVVLAAAPRCPRTTHYLSSSPRPRPQSRHPRALRAPHGLWGSGSSIAAPRPPNRTGGSPAYGSPVSGYLHRDWRSRA